MASSSAIDLASSAQILENEDPEPRLGMEAEEVFLSRKRRSPLPDWYFPRRPLQDITAMVINAREGGASQALGTKFLPEITQEAKKGDLITVERRMPGSQSQSKRPRQSISTRWPNIQTLQKKSNMGLCITRLQKISLKTYGYESCKGVWA
ncbi:hypothetical protein SELMODRAFT_422769 [Selaginella moellendorffii]|uniref:Uncharacterized protein n=1 Tax=Selaginella moellendorffii TaxID=88036 RepID=D8SJH5_SELML|nr:hypothetical protein SELMODRAFT_422769 [Selaginella moellendorffii]